MENRPKIAEVLALGSRVLDKTLEVVDSRELVGPRRIRAYDSETGIEGSIQIGEYAHETCHISTLNLM